MVFGSSGHFVDTVVELIQGKIWPNIEQWKASDEHSIVPFFLPVKNPDKGQNRNNQILGQ